MYYTVQLYSSQDELHAHIFNHNGALILLTLYVFVSFHNIVGLEFFS